MKKMIRRRALCTLIAAAWMTPGMSYALSTVQVPNNTGTLPAGAVAAPDQYGAATAAEILKQGGNAVDAAVATALTLAVTYQEAGNIGGGGFMTVYMHGKPYFLDYREVAPKAASKTMYLNEKGEVIPNLSLTGAKAAGVPGTVMGLWEAHRKFGKLKWADLVAPAIRYAENGYTVEAGQVERRNNTAKTTDGVTNFSDYFGQIKTGSVFRQPELAKTLRRIARDGIHDFYEGETAKLIVAQMQRDKGLISAQDLRDYRAKWRTPLSFNWRGNMVYTAPPPSSGGIGLKQLLTLKDLRAADFQGVQINSAQYIHLLAEIEKRVFADRANYLGDPDFSKVPVAQLTDNAYLARRAKEINPKAISPTEHVKPGLESTQTTHFSIVDQWGNAVSNTYTLNWYFGNGEVVQGAGFLLNDEMDDFSAKPGVANSFGVIGSDANAIAPGKRMLSSMSPTIITRDGKVNMVIGTPGGSRIFTSIFQVINGVYDYHLPLQEAVNNQRAHHQLLPKDTIFYDNYRPLNGKVAEDLRNMGYTLEEQSWRLGDIEAILIQNDRIETASDGRSRGAGLIVEAHPAR